jgi:enoyl-CoA hydratase/carnithine racemase
MDSSGSLDVVDEGSICWLQLNRPDKLNALNGEIRDGLYEELNRLVDEPATRVVVLGGRGRAFSAGVDLGAFGGDHAESDWSHEHHAAGKWQRVLDLLERIPQVTVASIHGHCIGGAALLAASCDIRIGADDLQVKIPELKLGIPLTWGGLPRLQREIGLPLTRDLVMTGRTLSSTEALSAGFIQRLVAADHLAEETRALVDQLLEQPVMPLTMTRAALCALSREQLGATAWADPDLLRWSIRESDT